MIVLGFAVTMQGEMKATAFGVALENSTGANRIAHQVEFSNDGSDLATRLYDTAEAVRTQVDSLQPDAVIVRRADFPPRGSRSDGPKVRLLFEGAIVSAARDKCTNTHLGTGHDLGVWCGTDKHSVETDAAAMIRAAGLAQKYKIATSAAIAGLLRP